MHLQLIAASFVEVLDEAKGAVGTAPPCSPKNGPAYLSRAFGRSLRLPGIRRIMASLYHPETNSKAERCHRTIRYHRTIKEQAKLVMHGAPSVLEKGAAAFADCCSHRRYRAVIGNVAPADGYYGRREETAHRRKEVSRKRLGLRRDDHRANSGQETGRECPKKRRRHAGIGDDAPHQVNRRY